MHVSTGRMERVASGSLLVVALASFGPRTVQAAAISFALTNFNESTLNLSDVLRAVNFHETDSFDVTIGGHTATFAASGPIASLTETYGLTAYTPTNAGTATYTMVQDNANLIEVLRSHAWIDDGAAPVHQVPIAGLTPGQSYEIQAFFHDGRTGSCGGFGCANRTIGYGDENGISTPQVTRGSGTIAIGTFTADSDTQMLAIGGGDWDAGLSGFVLRSSMPLIPGDTDGDGTGGEHPDDFEPIRANFRMNVSTREMGDLVTNGVVDFEDFREWKVAFLAGGGSLAGVDFGFLSNVPEPSALVLALVACLGLASVRRRHARVRSGQRPGHEIIGSGWRGNAHRGGTKGLTK